MDRGTYILSHPDAPEELFIQHQDMIFDPNRVIECKIVEAKMKLLHLGKKYDTWLQNLYHYFVICKKYFEVLRKL